MLMRSRRAFVAAFLALAAASSAAQAQTGPAGQGGQWRPDSNYHPDEYNAQGSQAAECVPVRRGEFDQFGDWVNVRASMCADGQGEPYIAPGTRRVIHDN